MKIEFPFSILLSTKQNLLPFTEFRKTVHFYLNEFIHLLTILLRAIC